MNPLITALILAVLASWLAIGLAYRRPLLALWREPVLRQPVLIIESDDWGPGGADHAQVLTRIGDLLARHADHTGRPACMTLGVALAVPDCQSIEQSGYARYVRTTLADERFAPVRHALLTGADKGVFALQLHGMEHLWPPALLEAAKTDTAVAAWLREGRGWDTESLPSPLQSRWVDASVLPSRALAPAAINEAVREEVQLFRVLFGAPPAVVVPPTFVWTATVERAWAEQGVKVIITPGRRLTARDAQGAPAMPDREALNHQPGEAGVRYLVRDVYFEPSLGHTAQDALKQVEARITLGRPALLETHRFNFTRGDACCAASIAELDSLLEQARARWPALRFMPSEELAQRIGSQSPEWVETHPLPRLRVFLKRARCLPRIGKLALLSGLVLPVLLLEKLLDRRPPPSSSMQSGVRS